MEIAKSFFLFILAGLTKANTIAYFCYSIYNEFKKTKERSKFIRKNSNREVTMKISPEVKNAVTENSPALVATVDKTGKPNVSAKGSLRVIDDEHLLFANIRSPRTIANLKENPQVAIICLNPATRKGCRIWGRAQIMTSGDLFDQLTNEYAARNMKVNHVVKITVDEAVAF